MRTNQTAAKDMDEYIAGFPNDVQEILEQIRMTIRKAAPEAEETISYQIPTFTLKGKYLVYFAAYKKHIGLYPAPRGSERFKKELSLYAGGKGTVRFPLDKPIPFGLIKKIVKFRVKENLERAKQNGRRNRKCWLRFAVLIAPTRIAAQRRERRDPDPRALVEGNA
jgi:uncharacterized protein YdhG (YjbR/CyaY superfamily)